MWEQIRSNRRRSAFVLVGMGVLFVILGMALGALVWPDPSDPRAWLAGGVGAFVFWLVLWAITLLQGDDILLNMAGAREIRHGDHPVLFNVVEEMAIAAQLAPHPRVFVVDDPSPNAFAAGRDPAKASVAVTTGLLRLLDRDELQGVVAHEIGHVKNRDVALVTTAGVMMGSIIMLSEIAMRVLRLSGGRRRSRSSNGKDGGAAILVIVALVLIVLSPVLAQLLYFALSRRREYLADASGALFTRYPEGLARALEKLGGANEPLADTSRVTAPMYIVRPLRAVRQARAGLFSTHPPLEERVRILREMGGADFGAYERAFRSVHGGRVVGARTLGETSRVGIRRPEPAGGAVGTASLVADAPAAPLDTPAGRARQASDAFLWASGYIRRACARCGTVVKVPQSLASRVFACPRCRGPLREERA